jgi:hypothetical protein
MDQRTILTETRSFEHEKILNGCVGARGTSPSLGQWRGGDADRERGDSRVVYDASMERELRACFSFLTIGHRIRPSLRGSGAATVSVRAAFFQLRPVTGRWWLRTIGVGPL